MSNVTALQPLDYVIVAGIAGMFLAIGFYYACLGGKQRTTKEYFRGDGNMNWIPIVMSMMASFINSTVMLGIPAEVYYFGFNYFWISFGSFIGAPIAMYGFLPVFYQMGATSIFKYLELRFSRTLRVCCSLTMIINLIVVTSFVIYAPALALSQVSGLSLWTSILSTTVVATIYTSIGGIKAVVWTDCLQLLVFAVASFSFIIKGCMHFGGVSYIFKKNIEGHRLDVLSFSLDPQIRFTFWGLLTHSVLKCLLLYGANQVSLQRYLCCRNQKHAQRTVWMSLLGSVFITAMYCFIGLILYATYWNCDPLASQQIQKHDQLFALFVMQTMSSIPGMLGLFVAGLFCAGLSTISSALNSLAALTLEDHVKPRWKSLTDKKSTLLSKFIAVGYGIFCLLMIAVVMNLGSVVQALQYMIGGTTGASLGLFVIGLMNPWANSKGTLVGVVCGLAISWWISLGNRIYRPPPNSLLPISTANCSDIIGDWTARQKPPHTTMDILEIYKISYVWILPIAVSVTVIVGSICSVFVAKMDKGSNKTVNMQLLSPFVHLVMKRFFSTKYKELEQKYKEEFGMELTNGTNINNVKSHQEKKTLMINAGNNN